MPERKTIKIENLMLDTENYRIGHQEGQPQAIRAIIEDQEAKILRLANDIIENGLSPIELFMARPYDGSSTQFVVIEGNRRTAAIKLVLQPELAEGTKHEQSFKALHSKHANDVPREIQDVVIFPSKKDGLLWIRRRHDRGLKGEGVEDWSSIARDRADADLGKPAPALDVRGFVLANANLPTELHKKIDSSKFKNTNLTRLLGTAYVQGVLGLKKDGRALTSNAQPEWLLKVLTAMVVTIAEEKFEGKPFSEATIDKLDQRGEFIDKLVRKHPKPSKVFPVWAIRADQKVQTSGKGSVKKGNIRLTPSTADRKSLIPSGCRIKLPAGRTANIFIELRGLDAERHKNAVAVLSRVFIEFSFDHYIKRNTITPKDDSLISKMNAVEKYMRDNKIFTDKELKPLRDIISNRHSPFSTESLNAYLHNPSYTPKIMELKEAWDDLQTVIEKLWKP